MAATQQIAAATAAEYILLTMCVLYQNQCRDAGLPNKVHRTRAPEERAVKSSAFEVRCESHLGEEQGYFADSFSVAREKFQTSAARQESISATRLSYFVSRSARMITGWPG